MKEVSLTICIPTFNRAKYLFVFLNKLAHVDENILNEIELKIFDNNSTDNTQQVIDSFKHIFRITSKKQKINIGGTRNVIDIIQDCKGKHVWVLGDDDYIIIDEFEIFFQQLISKSSDNTWYFVGFATEENQTPFDFDLICSYFNNNNLEKTIFKFGLNFTGFLGSHIFPSSSVKEISSIDELQVNFWPHVTLFLKSTHHHYFSNIKLSVKSGHLEWSSLDWYAALLSQILCLENSRFTFLTKIILMMKLVFSFSYCKHLIYSHISPNYNFTLVNKKIIEIKRESNYRITKTLLTFHMTFNALLSLVPNKFLMKIFSIKPKITKLGLNDANNRKL
jgi:glycosyltransferase involved in cell wall biosynthesis